jgi:hypothetical protein
MAREEELASLCPDLSVRDWREWFDTARYLDLLEDGINRWGSLKHWHRFFDL